jgi:hypothetical protein
METTYPYETSGDFQGTKRCYIAEYKTVKFYIYPLEKLHISWVPCHHDMARPQVADGADGLQIRVCEYIE